MQPSNLHQLTKWPCQDIVFCLAASDDSSRLWLGSSDAGVYEMDLTKEKPQRQRLDGEGHSSYVTCLARCGSILVTGSYDRQLIWWDTQTGQQFRQIKAHDKWIRSIVPTPDHSRLISVADDMQCRVWDVASGALLAEFSDHPLLTPNHYPSMLYAVAVSPDGTKIATGDRVGHVAVWDSETFEKLADIETPVMYTWDPQKRRHSIGGIRSLAFSSNGQRLAVGGIGKIGNIDHLGGPARLEVFNCQTGERQLELEDTKLKGLIEQISWGPDDAWLLTAGGDNKGFTTFYDPESGEMLQQEQHPAHIHGLWCDAAFENFFVAAHKQVSHWSMSEKET